MNNQKKQLMKISVILLSILLVVFSAVAIVLIKWVDNDPKLLERVLPQKVATVSSDDSKQSEPETEPPTKPEPETEPPTEPPTQSEPETEAPTEPETAAEELTELQAEEPIASDPYIPPAPQYTHPAPQPSEQVKVIHMEEETTTYDGPIESETEAPAELEVDTVAETDEAP